MIFGHVENTFYESAFRISAARMYWNESYDGNAAFFVFDFFSRNGVKQFGERSEIISDYSRRMWGRN